ncbi:hypothetical protein SPRG_02138 [Saprolegnia parasitica CBS 223.65]|uniref:Uncharacterized protein n=1 Tax=Saprolegnia parasitica (strain CBS 223.65) TaxID=695850 RepID=A0A067CVP7_SAPPC|nr:hypothetical protein SPRG_02138 [Saprolegnia parasitica CBS 223.65]KDO33330.1 hypothetical protein SPRG_02138 [Saprolegnia parasitica CBS 223.65]|eukprot:XP_012196079.1 hypothetical protein SPRG_02138 [Saprolegnia parasitica CBS 223.65]
MPNEYEAKRLARIAENKAMLASLGIDKQIIEKAAPKQRPAAKQLSARGPVRRSSRVQELHPGSIVAVWDAKPVLMRDVVMKLGLHDTPDLLRACLGKELVPGGKLPVVNALKAANPGGVYEQTSLLCTNATVLFACVSAINELGAFSKSATTKDISLAWKTTNAKRYEQLNRRLYRAARVSAATSNGKPLHLFVCFGATNARVVYAGRLALAQSPAKTEKKKKMFFFQLVDGKKLSKGVLSAMLQR